MIENKMKPGTAKSVTNSGMLRAKISLFDSPLSSEAGRMWTHQEFPVVFPNYLFQIHSIIRSTVPLLRAASAACRSPKYAAEEAVVRPAAAYLDHHAEEETGHDEWLLDAAEVMGVRRDSMLARIPSPAAVRIVGAQYYWIHHYHPIAFLGYIAVMEGTPGTVKFYENVARRQRLPADAIRNFVYHAKIDPKHVADFNKLVDNLPLTPHHLNLIGLSAIQTIHYLTAVLKEVNETK
jgi:predicted transcriptional regulator